MQVRGTFPELSAGMKKGKVHKVMGEFKRGTLHSGSKKGPKVTDRKQAVAIALSEARKEGGMAGFAVARVPRRNHAPATFAGRRAAAHRKAHPSK